MIMMELINTFYPHLLYRNGTILILIFIPTHHLHLYSHFHSIFSTIYALTK
jgi:hypothetical protein